MTSQGAQGLRLEYGMDAAQLGPGLSRRWVVLGPDSGLATYLEAAPRRRLGAWKTGLRRVLSRLFSDFDANALLGAYPMHLLSAEQWLTLLGGRVGGRLLDVGAGSGDATQALSGLFDEVVTTETSQFCARRLRRQGYECHLLDVAREGVPHPPYDAVACLNVLDRCAYPKTLLGRLTEALLPGGRLLLAMPLPCRPVFFDGPSALDPIERLPCEAGTWEEATRALVKQVLEPMGLSVMAISRTPYLSGGDTKVTFYELDDVVMVCQNGAEGSGAEGDWSGG